METALFSPSSLFAAEDEEENPENNRGEDADLSCQTYIERTHAFPGGIIISIREYSFHELNANLLWPGTFAFAEWLLAHPSYMQRKHILELGSGTGALSIFLKKTFQVHITTSDYDDVEIEENIAYNCRANNVELLPHIRHSWGEPFPAVFPKWDLIIASDILLYVKQYPNLIKTISYLLKSYKPTIQAEGNLDEVQTAQRGEAIESCSGSCLQVVCLRAIHNGLQQLKPLHLVLLLQGHFKFKLFIPMIPISPTIHHTSSPSFLYNCCCRRRRRRHRHHHKASTAITNANTVVSIATISTLPRYHLHNHP